MIVFQTFDGLFGNNNYNNVDNVYKLIITNNYELLLNNDHWGGNYLDDCNRIVAINMIMISWWYLNMIMIINQYMNSNAHIQETIMMLVMAIMNNRLTMFWDKWW